MKHGVYQIRNTQNGKIYIGSSIDIVARWRGHKGDIKYHRHHSSRLQYAWYKDGANVFVFEILEECNLNELEQREQYYLDTMLFASCNDNRFYRLGYNNSRDASQKTVTNKTRMKMSRAAKLKAKPSHITRQRMSEAQQGKRLGELSPGAKSSTQDVKQMLLMAINGCSDSEIAQKFGRTIKSVNNIINGRTWPHIKLDGKDQGKLKIMRSLNRNKLNARKSGELNGRSKLTRHIVWDIKDQIALGFSNVEIAKRYDVSPSTISGIKRGKTWKDV